MSTLNEDMAELSRALAVLGACLLEPWRPLLEWLFRRL